MKKGKAFPKGLKYVIQKNGYNPRNWKFVEESKTAIKISHKESGVRRVVIKSLVIGVFSFLMIVFNGIHANAEELVDPVADLPKICPEDIYMETIDLLERCVEAEAGNQDIFGKRMVASVILNRAGHPDFPDTIREVISQPGQFCVYRNGAIDTVTPSEETKKAVFMEIQSPVLTGLLYFSSEGFLPYGTPSEKIGDHYFNKE